MFRRMAVMVGVLAILGVGVGYGLLFVPAIHPEEMSLREKDKKAPRPNAYLEYMAFKAEPYCEGKDPDSKRACLVNNNGSDTDPRLLPLRVPHKWGVGDGQWMARILKDKIGLKTDEAIHVNYDGRSNCDFSKYGLAHISEADRYGAFVVGPSGKSAYEEYGLSVAAGVFGLRDIYVTPPVYSLFRTRLKIAYGLMADGGSGSVCYFNRFSGDWHQEGECQLEWVS